MAYVDLLTKSAVGLGLRSPHYSYILENKPDVPWWEVHSENFFYEGNKDVLRQFSDFGYFSFHGVGLSLGSSDGLQITHLKALRALVDEFNPFLLSEHVSWSSVGEVFANDLLPLPYTNESLTNLVKNIKTAQDFLGRKIMIENPSSYVEFKENQMSEWQFLNEAALQADCGILLDINNIFVSSINHNFDADQYINNIAAELVSEIHLAGPSRVDLPYEEKKIMYIDTHDSVVLDEVWDLYRKAIAKCGKIPTLIEWDSDIPEFNILFAEKTKADNIIKAHNLR